MYRRPEGRKWSGQEIDEATGGVVTRSYLINLRKGCIENPGYEKMRSLAKAMGSRRRCGSRSAWAMKCGPGEEGRDIAGSVEHLFDVTKNPGTGKPYNSPSASTRR